MTKNKVGLIFITVTVTMLMIPGFIDAARQRNYEYPLYSHVDYREDVLWCIDHNYYPTSADLDTPVTCTNSRGEEVKYPPHNPYKELRQ